MNNTNYKTRADLNIYERATEEELLKQHQILDEWTFASSTDESLCGNIRAYGTDKGIKLTQEFKPEYISSCQLISSALAMYRINSLSQGEAMTLKSDQDFYKVTWSAILIHKKTKEVLMLGEWKGGFQIFTKAHQVKQLDKQFVKDAEKFLNFFTSDRVFLGYDGTVAGSVA